MIPLDTPDDQDAALRTLADYYRAFSTLEVQAVLPYFHEPSLLISPQGVLAAPTLTALTVFFVPAMEGLRTREFGRSELSVGFVESLSSSATLITGVALRYRRIGDDPPGWRSCSVAARTAHSVEGAEIRKSILNRHSLHAIDHDHR
jgi:hypothetical protein